MDITVKPGTLSGSIAVIPSKSQAHRLLICAVIAIFAVDEKAPVCAAFAVYGALAVDRFNDQAVRAVDAFIGQALGFIHGLGEIQRVCAQAVGSFLLGGIDYRA